MLLLCLVLRITREFMDNKLTSQFLQKVIRWDFDSNLLTSLTIDNVLGGGQGDWWLGRIPVDNSTSIAHHGARHPNGSLGMIVNPSVERLRRPTMETILQISNSTCPDVSSRFGIEGEGGNAVLHKIRRGLQKAKWQLQHNSSLGKPPKILCMIYTVFTDNDQHSGQAAIADTWGKECDGFIGASNLTDHSIGTIDLPHYGPEEYKNMWQKIRSIWTYAYDHYLNDYDYFYIAGDDTYVLVDNMRLFLQGPEVKRLEQGYLDRISMHHAVHGAKMSAQLRPRPLFFGNLMIHKRLPVIAGGPGYILNKAALQLWGENGADSFRTTWQDPREDVFMADFFFTQRVFISETQDSCNGWRFAESAQLTSEFNGINSPITPAALKAKYGFEIPPYLDSVSEYEISFHLKYDKNRLATLGLSTRDLILRYHAFFNGWCRVDNFTR